MLHLVRCRATASETTIHAALERTRAHTVALAFPLGQPSPLASERVLNDLYQFCESLGKTVVIFGGDEHLRAAAVAAGFTTATSADEWEEAPPAAHEEAATQLFGEHAGWDGPELAMVRPTDDLDAADDIWTDEPPEYVRELLARSATSPTPPAGPRGAPITQPLSEQDDAEALRVAAEHYEERITTTIRNTGGLVPRTGSTPTAPSPRPGDTGDERAPGL